MKENQAFTLEEEELRVALDSVLRSNARKKLVIAGPGTGKTTLFKELLKRSYGDPESRIVLTFINNLKNDLERDLQDLAKVYTLHSFCLGLLYQEGALRFGLSRNFVCVPRLASLISRDWEIINGDEAPKFVSEMRGLADQNHTAFYIDRGNYYDSVDFDDSVYRVYMGYTQSYIRPKDYDLVLIDEYQDFNRLEAGIVDILGENNPIMIAGDDDQALYSQLRSASWEYIRSMRNGGEYEVFKLPFCMRCPKVIVDAVNGILTKARLNHNLDGRIEKPYRFFPLVKGEDSNKYPKITVVETSTQSKKVNFFGKYIEEYIKGISENEISQASEGNFPTVLIIAAEPYRGQIIDHLKEAGFDIETSHKHDDELNREKGLTILQENPESNIGWRILLEFDKPLFLEKTVIASAGRSQPLINLIPEEYRNKIQIEVDELSLSNEENKTTLEKSSDKKSLLPEIRVTSFEGSKGMSAQHVFIAGLHRGEIPRDSSNIKDLEICKFVVGLTRTRKKCTLLYTKHFGISWKDPSPFISWIEEGNIELIKVSKQYWEK